MRNRICLSISLLITLIAETTMSANYVVQESNNAQSEKIKKLMIERCEILNERVEYLESLMNSGATLDVGQDGSKMLIDAREDLFVAKIELAESREQRIELHKSRIENLKRHEQNMLAIKEAGGRDSYTYYDLLMAKSCRLEAEIEYERAITIDQRP